MPLEGKAAVDLLLPVGRWSGHARYTDWKDASPHVSLEVTDGGVAVGSVHLDGR